LFDAGQKVMVYPGGDLDAMRSWRDRKKVIFGPRRGYVKLALRAGVPIVPVVTAGGHEIFRVVTDGRRFAHLIGADRYLRLKVWPVIISFPWGVTVGPPPPCIPWRTRIFQEALEPIVFDRSGEDAAEDAEYVEACHARVLATMQAALTRLYAERDGSAGRLGEACP
jgi:1-acyl-sn-glycerol-3-phosphate acyltransferase